MRHVRGSDAFAGFGAIALIALMLVPWYYVDDGVQHTPPIVQSAWQTLSVSDIVLFALALVPLALVAAQATRPSPAVPVALSVLTLLAGALAVVLIAVRLIVGVDAGTPRPGAFFALAAAVAITVAGWRSMRDESMPERPQPVVERVALR